MTDAAPAPDDLTAGRAPKAIARFLLIVIVLLAVDLGVKSMSFARVTGTPVTVTRDAAGQVLSVPPHDPVTAIPGILSLRLTLNHGAVFGLGQGGRWLFVGFTVIAILVIGSIFIRSSARAVALHVLLAAVLSGALGNLYDRLVYGVVRDMFHLFPNTDLPFGWSWPGGARGLYPWIFNVADVCLVVGLFALVLLLHKHDKAQAREARA